MNDINSLYDHLELFDQFSTKEEFLKYLDEKEEEYLTNEVLPFLEEKLKTLKRKFKLVIEFDPKEGLNFSLSHSSIKKDAKKEKQPTETKKKRRVIRKDVDLKVITSDGTVIQEGKAKDTYVKTIKTIGVKAMLKFDRTVMGRPFLYKGLNPKYKEYEQPLIDQDYRINVCFGHLRKKEYLQEIFADLGLSWSVEIVDN